MAKKEKEFKVKTPSFKGKIHYNKGNPLKKLASSEGSRIKVSLSHI